MTNHHSDLVANMTEAVPASSFAKRMRKQGCRVSLDGLERERLIIDVDEIVPDGEVKCDYLFITNQPLIVPIEMKSGEVGASEAQRQLQAGADLAHKLVKPSNLRCDLKPIAFARRIHPLERQRLKQSSHFVRYRGEAREITVASCGSFLVDALR